MYSMKLDSIAFSPRVRNPVLLGLVATLVFLVLVAYSPLNPDWGQASNNEAIRNIFGPVGLFCSNILVAAFGQVSYAIPILLFVKVLSIVAHPRESRWWVGLMSVGGFLLVVFSLCLLYAAWVGGPLEEVGKVSGTVGSWIAIGTFPLLNAKIAAIVSTVGLLVGIHAMVRLPWLNVMETVGGFLVIAVSNTKNAGIAFFRFVRNRQHGKIERSVARPGVTTVRKRETGTATRKRATSSGSPRKRQEPKLNTTSKATVPSRKPSANSASKQRLGANSGLPDLALLESSRTSAVTAASQESINRVADQLAKKLADFGVDAEVVSVLTGPVVTRFEIQPAPGLKVSKIASLAKDLARALAVMSVRIVEVIPGKSVVGIEIPNEDRSLVGLQEVLRGTKRSGGIDSPLSIVLGKDVAGVPVFANIERMPHLLVAGTTGSGKSVCINAILISLLLHTRPEQVRLILIDPKMLELSIYEDIPHLLTPVVTDMQEASRALGWCIAEMERRYQLMAALSVRNLAGYNALIEFAERDGETVLDPLAAREGRLDAEPLTKLPSIVVIVDEFADMMMIVGKKVEQLIARIAQKARAAGIHLILATQRPSVDVITGLIKANIPCRISFQVSSKIDSRTILDQGGAEQLLGHGDMLYLPPGSGVPVRVHGAFVSDTEVIRVAEYWRSQAEPDYVDEVTSDEAAQMSDSLVYIGSDDEKDENYDEAVDFVLQTRKASISSIQRKFRIGYNRAARIVEAMESEGIVSAPNDMGNREVLAKQSQ